MGHTQVGTPAWGTPAALHVCFMSQARMVLSLANQLATRMELASDSADFLKKLMDLAFKCHAHFTRADHSHWVATVDFIKAQTAEAKLPAEHPLMVRLKQGEYTVTV